jgi:hypothetical protein
MKYVLPVLFILAALSMMGAEVLIGWFGPWITIAPAILLFHRWMKSPVGFGLAIYGTSIVLGIVAMEGFGMSNGDSARLAGWVLPPALVLTWLAFTFLVRLPSAGENPRLEALAQRVGKAGALFGAVALGALLGALLGSLCYYIWDVGLLADLVFPENADTIVITTSCVGGAVYAGWVQLRGQMPEPPPIRTRKR